MPSKQRRTKSSMPFNVRTEPDGGQCFHFFINPTTAIHPYIDLNDSVHSLDLAVPTPADCVTFDAIKLQQWETDTARTLLSRYDRGGMDVWDVRFVTEHPAGMLQIYGERLTAVLARTRNSAHRGG